MPMDVDTHVALGLDQPTPIEINGRSNADGARAIGHPDDAVYHPCADAYLDPETPRGRVTKHADWAESKIFANTVRDMWVYVPADYDDTTPLRLLVCNDGRGYMARKGAVRATNVLDNLHARGEMPPTAALFINPGRPPGADPFGTTPFYDAAATQRSYEYDSLTPDYGNFLLDEVMPFAAGEHGLVFSDDPSERAVCGISSGGICAFSVAWFHTAAFARVISHCGSYTNIRGGHNYPYLVRTTQHKDIRVFLQSGAQDIATLFGDWATANQAMAAAFAYVGYDHRFVFGQGGHTLRHGGAIFADTLKWLFS